MNFGPSQEPPGPLRTSILGEFRKICYRFFGDFGYFSDSFFHHFSMTELGWEHVPHKLGRKVRRQTWVGTRPTQVLRDVIPPKFATAPSHPVEYGTRSHPSSNMEKRWKNLPENQQQV